MATALSRIHKTIGKPIYGSELDTNSLFITKANAFCSDDSGNVLNLSPSIYLPHIRVEGIYSRYSSHLFLGRKNILYITNYRNGYNFSIDSTDIPFTNPLNDESTIRVSGKYIEVNLESLANENIDGQFQIVLNYQSIQNNDTYKKTIHVIIAQPIQGAPTWSWPEDGVPIVDEFFRLEVNSPGSDTDSEIHIKTEFQISQSSTDFETLLQSHILTDKFSDGNNGPAGLTSSREIYLNEFTTLPVYARARFFFTTTGWGPWSDVIEITDGRIPIVITRLDNPDFADTDKLIQEFGFSLDFDTGGDLLAVSSPRAIVQDVGSGGIEQGVVYIYDIFSNPPVISDIITSPEPLLTGFGYAVSISKGASTNRLLITNRDNNKAYMFRNDVGSWYLESELTPTLNTLPLEYYGHSCCMSRDGAVAFVSDLYGEYSTDPREEGAVYVFEYNSSTDEWVNTARLKPSLEHRLMGGSIDCSANGSKLVCSYLDGINQRPCFVIFENAEGSWINIQEVQCGSDGWNIESDFNYKVRSDQNMENIAASYLNMLDYGRVEIYRDIGNGGYEIYQVLTSYSEYWSIGQDEKFGADMRFTDSNELYIGAPGRNNTSAPNPEGAVYYYKYSTETDTYEIDTIIEPHDHDWLLNNSIANEWRKWLGYSIAVALDGTKMFSTAIKEVGYTDFWDEVNNFNETGAVYFFK